MRVLFGLIFVAAVASAETLPERWLYESPYIADTETDAQWWRTLGDPVLDTLVAAGRSANYDVAAAMRRLDAARARTGAARAGWYPTIGVSAGYNKERARGVTSGAWSAGADMAWEIDVFGRVRAAVRERKAQWRASRADAEGTLLSITAEIASDYVNLCMTEQQLAVAREHAASQSHILTIAQARHEAGLASALDVAQASNVYYSTLSTIAPLEASAQTLRNTLCTLLGRYPGALDSLLTDSLRLPWCPEPAATGVPADLLRRRPDIIAAEQQVAAAAAAIGIARKEFLPTLELRGNIATEAPRLNGLFSKGSLTYSIAPTLTWTVFSGFSRKYALAEARAQAEELVDAYNSTVITAVAEAGSQMSAYSNAIANLANLSEAAAQSRKALELSVDLYKSGNTGFYNVADAQISYLTNTNALISARASALLYLIGLYKALGGAPVIMNN